MILELHYLLWMCHTANYDSPLCGEAYRFTLICRQSALAQVAIFVVDFVDKIPERRSSLGLPSSHMLGLKRLSKSYHILHELWPHFQGHQGSLSLNLSWRTKFQEYHHILIALPKSYIKGLRVISELNHLLGDPTSFSWKSCKQNSKKTVRLG